MDEHAEDEEDDHGAVFMDESGNDATVPCAANLVYHVGCGLPCHLVRRLGVEVGARTEEKPGEGDESESLCDRPCDREGGGETMPHLMLRYLGAEGEDKIVDETYGCARPKDDRGDGEHAQGGDARQAVGEDESKGAERGEKKAYMPIHVAPELIDNHADTVQSSPNHEVPTGTMPQPAEEHGDERVEVGVEQLAVGRAEKGDEDDRDCHGGNDARRDPRTREDEGDQGDEGNPEIGAESGIAVTSEGDIEVGFEPSGKGHMPPAPELLRVLRLVGRVEVLREVEAHEQSDSDGDVGVSGEVGIDLKRVGKEGEEVLETAEKQRVVEDTVNEIDGEVVAEYNLLRQAVEYPKDRDAELPPAEAERLVNLRDKLLGAHDRTGDQLREEGNIEAEVQQVADRNYLAAIDVRGVGDDLEDIETDADGQDDAADIETSALGKAVADICEDIEYAEAGAEEVVDHVGEEIGVLEVREQPEVDDDRERQPRLGGTGSAVGQTVVYLLGNQPVGEGDEEQNEKEKPAGLVVEKPRDEEQEDVAEVQTRVGLTAHYPCEDGIDDCEKRPEIELGEQQWRPAVEGEYMMQKIHDATCFPK